MLIAILCLTAFNSLVLGALVLGAILVAVDKTEEK